MCCLTLFTPTQITHIYEHLNWGWPKGNEVHIYRGLVCGKKPYLHADHHFGPPYPPVSMATSM